MHRPADVLLALACLLSLSTDAGGQSVNLGVPGLGRGVRDGLHFFAVDEGDAGQSFNGDADTNDLVAHVYNLRTGVLTNLGLACSGLFDENDFTERWLAFHVIEANQGNTDLNGDGDTLDDLLALYDVRKRTFVGLLGSGLERYLRVREDLVLFARSELAEAQTNLNGDGDTLDDVLHAVTLGLDAVGYRAVGAGLAGSGGLAPRLSGVGCPALGGFCGVLVADGLGGAPTVLVVGLDEVALRLLGGTLYVFPFEILELLAQDGPVGLAGAGSGLATFLFADRSLAGTTLVVQAGLLDAGAPAGVALTNAIEAVFAP